MFVCFHAPSLTSGILSWELDSLVDSFSFFPTMTEASSSSPRVHLFFSSRWRQREWRKIWILFEAVSFCPDVLLVSSPQLSWNLPRARSLLRSCPESSHPWGWQLYRSHGKTLLNAPLCFTESHWTCWVDGVVGGTFPLMLHEERGCCFVIMPSQHRVPVLNPNNKPNPPLYLYCFWSWGE